jgi:hypothetical protein
MNRSTLLSALLAAAILFAAAGTAADRPPAEHHVYLSLADALADAFPDADALWTETWAPDAAELDRLSARLGSPQPPGEIVFHRARRGAVDLGWAVSVDEIGLHEPITMLVHVDADRRVGAVRVLVFRESRGDDVKRLRFLKQFRGKTVASTLRVGRDVDAVTGATYSSRAVTGGVRRALELIEARYPNEAGR